MAKVVPSLGVNLGDKRTGRVQNMQAAPLCLGLHFFGDAMRAENGARDEPSSCSEVAYCRGSRAAGRLHRLHATKLEVVIYDYVDAAEPLLAKMAGRREAGYRALGYDVTHADDLFSRETAAPIRKTG